MSAIKLDTFGGMVPAVDKRLLPPKSAGHSENTWLYSGRLAGIPQPTLVRACTPGTSRVFRIPMNYTDAAHLSSSTWMEFQDPDTDVVRSLVVGDTFGRYYWAASSVEPRYNTLARITNGDTSWKLGVPAPTLTSVVGAGGVAPNVSRAYVATYVTAYGEEGPASLPIVTTNRPDGTWTVTIVAADSLDLGGVGANRYITNTNIYRTVTGTDGTTTYFLVATVPVATLTYADVLADAVVSASSALQSTNWIGPPSDLAGVISMPNGMLAGWRKNELWFCEPYRPHAWPAAYSVTVDYPIVGLGVTNQTLVVCTQGYPVTASGVHPASVALSKSASLEPCLSRGSILSTTEGVYYASPNGLVFAGQGSINNITRTIITKDKWGELVATASLRAARLGTAYFAFGSSQAGMFDPLSFDPLSFAQVDFHGAYQGIVVDPADPRVAFNLLSEPVPVVSTMNDPWSGEIFIIKSDNNLYRIDISATDPVRRVYKWRSKIFQMADRANLGAMRVYWIVPTAAAPDVLVAPPAGSYPVEFPVLPGGSTYGVVRVYADDVLKLTRNLVTPGEIIRLPSGFKADFYQLEFETYVDVTNVQVASSVKALKAV